MKLPLIGPLKTLPVLLLALLLAACAPDGGEQHLIGQITCPPDTHPPADATLRLQLNELTGGYPNTLATQLIPWPGACPIPFEMAYDSDKIDPLTTYTLLVTLETQTGKYEVIYAGRQDVFTFFNPSSDIEVEIEDLNWENNPTGEFGP
jgi:hypothetical protein